MKKIYRCPEQGKIAGICFALGKQYNTDPVLIRMLMLLLLFAGPDLLLYVIAWMIIPTKDRLQ